MERKVGTVSRGIRCPIIRQGDDLANIVVTSVLEAAEQEGFQLRDQDVIAVTESIVARAQGNYVSVDDIAADVRAKFGTGAIGVILPILSRNRFAICLRGIAKGADKIVLMLSYPSDEVGNGLVTLDQLDEAGVNPYSDVLTLERYRELFGENKHPFTGGTTSSITATSFGTAAQRWKSSWPTTPVPFCPTPKRCWPVTSTPAPVPSAC